MCVIAPRALDEILGFRRSFWKGIVGYIRNIISRAEGATSRFEARVSGKLKIFICTYCTYFLTKPGTISRSKEMKVVSQGGVLNG